MNQVVASRGRASNGLRPTWRPSWRPSWRPKLGGAYVALLEAERGRFVPWLAVAAIAGVLLYFLQPIEPAPLWTLGALAGAAALLGATMAIPALRLVPLRAPLLAALAAAIGFGSAHWAAMRAAPMDTLPSRAVVLQATVRGVDVLPEGRRLVLSDVVLPDQPAPLARLIRVRTKRGDETPVVAGDHITVRALLRPPGAPAYPGGWDQQRDAWFTGIGGGGTALSPVTVTEHAAPAGFAAGLQALRDTIGARALAALPGTDGAVAATLLTGTTRAIPEADRAAFRDSGLAHLLAVAGLHIGIVMGLFMLAGRLALAAWPHAALHWPTKALAAGLALAAGAAYLLLTGGHVPIMRSFAMAALFTLGIAVGRRSISLRALALAAVAVVLIAPHEVVGVSFQMSFAAVAALIAGYEALRPALARLHGPGWRRVAHHVAMLALTSAIAGTAAAPVGAYHFGHVQLYYIAANLVAVPLTAFWVLPLGIAALALMPVGLEQLAFIPMGWGLDAIVWVARAVAAWPLATLPAPGLPGWGLALFGLGLAWLCLWRSRLRLAGLAIIAAGLLSPLVAPPPDILVSNDARLIAWRGPQGYALQVTGSPSWFTRDAWREHLGVEAWRSLDEGCDPIGCRMRGALLLRTAGDRVDCAGVRLLVAAEPARGSCRGVALIDRFTVWRDGAHAAWLTAGAPIILSDRAARGDRPWVPPRPQPRPRASTLPRAPIDPLPPATEE